MSLNEREIREQICEIGRRIYNRNMVAANDGNISVKLNDNEILCTPTGISKGFMTPECICKVDALGNVIQSEGGYKPSSEMKMHMRVYQKRADIGAVVHAHPVHATAFAVAGIPLSQPVLSEAIVSLGAVPIVEYGTPSTMEIPDNLEKYLGYYDAVLLENHGALTYSTDLLSAYMKMESLEFFAQILLKAKTLGDPKEFSVEEIRKLYEVRKKMAAPGKHPANVCFESNPRMEDGTEIDRTMPGYQYDFSK